MRFILLSALGSVAAQQFSDFEYDYDAIQYTTECKTSLKQVLDCSSLLTKYEFHSIDFSTANLTELCTSGCRSSLSQLQTQIQSSCPRSANSLTLDDGTFYTATDRINLFLDVFNKVCLVDPQTQEFCYDVAKLWPNSDKMTSAQNCSDCNLALLQLDQSSEFSYEEKVASEFSSLTSSCGKIGFEPQTPTGRSTHSATAATTASATPSCTSLYTIQSGDTCDSICKSHNVSTYALTQVNGLAAYCKELPTAGTQLCMPDECDIYTVAEDDTCYSIDKRLNSTFSVTQLLSWNPQLNELCTNMPQQVDTQICVSPPGQIRAVVTNTQAPADTPTTAMPAPNNVASGTVDQCGKYYEVIDGDDCATVSLSQSISVSDFHFLNPGINTNFPEETWTVGPDGIPVPAGVRLRTTISISLNPYATGTVEEDQCANYLVAREGLNESTDPVNSCEFMCGLRGLAVEDFIKLNPSLQGVQPCVLKTGFRYCYRLKSSVSAGSTAATRTDNPTQASTATEADTTSTETTSKTTTSSTNVSTPSPSAGGMTSGCTTFYKVQDGDYCWKICNDNNIAMSDFIQWNPSVGSDCSLVEKDVYYCIAH